MAGRESLDSCTPSRIPRKVVYSFQESKVSDQHQISPVTLHLINRPFVAHLKRSTRLGVAVSKVQTPPETPTLGATQLMQTTLRGTPNLRSLPSINQTPSSKYLQLLLHVSPDRLSTHPNPDANRSIQTAATRRLFSIYPSQVCGILCPTNRILLFPSENMKQRLCCTSRLR